jgi:hypothetical protein
MHSGDFVRATRSIDYGQHGSVKKGEPGIILGGKNADGRFDVRWLGKHRRMADWRNQSRVELDEIEVIAPPRWITRWQAAALGFVFCGLWLLAFLLPMPIPSTHHWLYHRAGGKIAEQHYMERNPPQFLERVVDGANGTIWLVAFERVSGRHIRVSSRRELTTPEQIELELRRLNEP